MAQVQPVSPQGQGDGGGNENVSFGKKLLLVALLCLAGFLLYKIFWQDSDVQNSIPRAMQVTYQQSDFKMNLDERATLEILSNPARYRNEFDELILNFNSGIVSHVCNRMGLNAQLKAECLAEYKKMHPYIRQMYYNDFVGLTDTTNRIYQTWYENQAAGASELLNEVASKYTCFFITNIIGTVLKTQDGKLAVNGKKVETPCGIALTEGVRPMIKRLSDAAAVRDFTNARQLMKEKVERTITELAVKEISDKKGIRVTNPTKVMGYEVSQTNIEIVAVSVMKIGFKLDKNFDVQADDKTKKVIVTLPQPQILSHEVYPKVENLDVGWLREINSQDFNESINRLRQAFRDDVMNSQAFEQSKQRAREVMDLMLAPAVKNINRGYKVEVRFQQPTAVDYGLPKK